jgi:hypothetical protein
MTAFHAVEPAGITGGADPGTQCRLKAACHALALNSGVLDSGALLAMARELGRNLSRNGGMLRSETRTWPAAAALARAGLAEKTFNFVTLTPAGKEWFASAV